MSLSSQRYFNLIPTYFLGWKKGGRNLEKDEEHSPTESPNESMQLVLESSEEKETETEMMDEKEKNDKESKDDSVLILMNPTNKVKTYLTMLSI